MESHEMSSKKNYEKLSCKQEIDSYHVTNIHNAAKDGEIRHLQFEIEKIFSEIFDGAARAHALGRKDTYQLTPLLYAVKYNNKEAVQLLLEKGADVNGKGKDGSTPLHYATRFVNLEEDCSIIEHLMFCHADVNATDDFGLTPLHYACSRGNISSVKKLLTSEFIDVQAVDKLRSTPLHAACSYGSEELVTLLVDYGAKYLSGNEANMTPLHVACSHGHKKVLEQFFKLIEDKDGASGIPQLINQQSIEGQSLLHLAVLGSYTELAKLLLERGSDVNQCMDGCETCLHIVAVTGHLEIVNLLLEYGVDMDRKNDEGRTALHKAARFGKHEVVRILIKHGANINSCDEKRSTPLLLAAGASGNSETVKVLLENNADINLLDKEHRTTLHMAVMDNNIEVAKTLLECTHCPKVVNMWDKDCNTSLHIACANGYETIAKMLIDKNADVQSRNNDEKTPLHLAAYYGQTDVVMHILKINPSTINEFDQKGNSALHLASSNGFDHVIKYLLKCGAAVNDKNTESMTPLDCAAENGKTAAVEVLLWGGASVLPSGEFGWGPLHRSAKEGYAETTQLLLQYCDISATDINGRNPLDLAIENHHKDAVAVFLNHRDWKIALRNKSLDNGMLTTPVRKMITYMPDMAYYTFSRCISESSEYSNDHINYCITVTFEFLDDAYVEWPCDIVRRQVKGDHGDKGEKEVMTRDEIMQEIEKSDCHNLSHMISQKRKKLVMHPLCGSLLEHKWRKFASYVYYFKLLLYTCFLMFLTGYIVVSSPLPRDHNCKIKNEIKTWDRVLFLKIGIWVVLFLAIVNLFLEMVQIVSIRTSYFTLANLFDLLVYLIGIFNVLDDHLPIPGLFPHRTPPLESLNSSGLIPTTAHAESWCMVFQKSTGALSVFFGWCNFILYIRKVSIFGIYIVMFLYVLKTFVNFFIVFTFLIIAFGFSFFVILHDQTASAFGNPVKSLIKTIVMMTGELDFENLFDSTGHHLKTGIIWILFVTFILIMNIVLMNLLVGLAVDDIQSVQEEAEFTTAKMKIDVCLHAEKRLPKWLRERFQPHELHIYPNRRKGIPKPVKKHGILSQMTKILIDEKDSMNDLQDNLKRLDQGVSMLEAKVGRIDQQLEQISLVNAKLDDVKALFALNFKEKAKDE